MLQAEINAILSWSNSRNHDILHWCCGTEDTGNQNNSIKESDTKYGYLDRAMWEGSDKLGYEPKSTAWTRQTPKLQISFLKETVDDIIREQLREIR